MNRKHASSDQRATGSPQADPSSNKGIIDMLIRKTLLAVAAVAALGLSAFPASARVGGGGGGNHGGGMGHQGGGMGHQGGMGGHRGTFGGHHHRFGNHRFGNHR